MYWKQLVSTLYFGSISTGARVECVQVETVHKYTLNTEHWVAE